MTHAGPTESPLMPQIPLPDQNQGSQIFSRETKDRHRRSEGERGVTQNQCVAT